MERLLCAVYYAEGFTCTSYRSCSSPRPSEVGFIILWMGSPRPREIKLFYSRPHSRLKGNGVFHFKVADEFYVGIPSFVLHFLVACFHHLLC